MKHHPTRRWAVFAFGVAFTAMGISLITTGGLGSSPVTSFAYAITFILPGSLGLYSFVVNSALFFGEVLLQGRQFPRIQLLQLPTILLFSVLIDGWRFLFRFLQSEVFLLRLLVVIAGCCALGLGIALQVMADVLILPAEGFVKVVAQKLGREFGVVKTFYDAAMVLCAILISLLCLGSVAGVGLGTVIAALITGGISRFFRVRLEFLVREETHDAPQVQENG